MRFMLIMKADRDSEAGMLPDAALLQAMGDYNAALVKAGVLLAGEALQASSRGARVHSDGEQRLVERGPFSMPDTLVAGFWLIEVPSLDIAIEWVRRCPNPGRGHSQIEIRPVFETEDSGVGFTPEPRARDAAPRTTTQH